MGFFWAKYILFDLKKYEGYKIWRGIDSPFQNWHKEFDKNWSEQSKISKIFILIGSFWAKYIFFELKRYREVIFRDIEEWCKIWRKTDLLHGKWHEEFCKFSWEHLKASKLELWYKMLLYKVENVWALNLQWSYMCHANEEWYKNCRGTDFWF